MHQNDDRAYTIAVTESSFLWKITHIATACGVAFIVSSLTLIKRDPVKVKTQSLPSPLQKRLDNAIQDIGPYATSFPPTFPTTQPRIIQTIRIIPGIVETPGAQVVTEPVVERRPKIVQREPIIREVRRRSTDCRVYGMRKVYINKHTWRCRK